MALNYQAAVEINAQFKGESEVDKASKSLEKVGKSASSIDGQVGKVTGALKALAGAYAVQQTISYAKSLIDLGDTFNDLRQKTGLSIDTLSGLKTAAELNGLEFDSLQGALKKFTVTVGNADAGVKASESGFKALGISLKESNGTFKTSDKLLFEVSDKFKNLPDGADKAAVAVKLFGKQGADLIPLLNQGSEELTKYGIKFGDFGAKADEFNDSLTILGVAFTQLGINSLGPLLPTLTQVATALSEFFSEIQDGSGDLEGLGDVFKAVTLAFVAFGESFIQGVDAIYTSFKQLGEEIGYIAANIADRFTTLSEQIVAAKNFSLQQLSDLEDAYESRKAARAQDFAKSTEKREEEFAQRTTKRLESLKKLYDNLYKPLPERDNTKAPKPKGTIDRGALNDAGGAERDSQLKREAAAIRDLESQKQELIQLYDLERQKLSLSTEEYKKRELAIKESAKADKQAADFTAANKARYEELTQAIIDQKKRLIDLQAEQKKSFGAGAQEAIKDYVENASDSARQTKDLFSTAFKGLEDSLVDFVKTGKLSFADLASSISEMLIRIAVQKAIAFGLQSAGLAPFADGGIMTSEGPVPLRKYANGGVATSPQLALFGEGSKPEAYVPLPDGRNIPVKMEGAGGGSNNVTVNVNVSGGSSTDEGTTSDTDKGRELGKLISNAITAALIKEQRPGGLLAARA